MKILIVGGDAVSRRLLVTVLGGFGHVLFTAESGEQAWKRLREQYFPVVISGWVMGPELCRRIRARAGEPYTYIVLLTSRLERQDGRAALDAGADDFLVMPLDFGQLAARLRVAEHVLRLEEDVQRQQVVPTCSYCHRIRDDAGGGWSSMEAYFAKKAHPTFSHGICPDCLERTIKPELEARRTASATALRAGATRRSR